MFAGFNTASLIDAIQAHLAMRIGKMYFVPFNTCILVLALGAALLSALKLWRIGEREDRERRLFQALHGKPGETRRIVLERGGSRLTVNARVTAF